MFTRVILAVGCVHSEAQATGDEAYERYLDEQIFPFLEAERRSAHRVPEGGEVVRLRLVERG
jgi:hypothetical protein